MLTRHWILLRTNDYKFFALHDWINEVNRNNEVRILKQNQNRTHEPNIAKVKLEITVANIWKRASSQLNDLPVTIIQEETRNIRDEKVRVLMNYAK